MRWLFVTMAAVLLVASCGTSNDDVGRATHTTELPDPTSTATEPATTPVASEPAETATLAPTDPVASPTDAGTLVYPTLHELQPAVAAPGMEVDVIASGGHIRIEGGYIESTRSFELTLAGSTIGQITCYISQCGGSFYVPTDLTPGDYAIATEGGSQLTLRVAMDVLIWPELTALQPAVALPGDAVTVLGNGGYVHLAASGASKLLQTFDLLLDGRPIGELSCADDHCQGSFVVPVDLPLGSHVVEAEGGSQLTLTVVVT